MYVTHDQSEALAMSDTIAVINKGHMVQVGSPREIYFEPANEFVAGFVGHTNILRGQMGGLVNGSGLHAVSLTGGGALRARARHGANGDVAVSIRPEDIVLSQAAPSDPDALNTLSGTVTSASFLGNVMHYEIAPEGASAVFRVEGAPARAYEPGAQVTMSFRPEDTIAVPQG